MNNYLFYCDSETELVVVPMKHGIDMVFVLGSTSGLTEKIGKAQKTTVNVSIPKFVTETTLDSDVIIPFLKETGIVAAFGDSADFSPMLDEGGVYIDEIIQKTKISVDEQGVVAAAATTISLMKGLPKYGEPVDFRLDRPFSYGIYYSESRVSPDELLFFGQYTGVE
jgi:serpin B